MTGFISTGRRQPAPQTTRRVLLALVRLVKARAQGESDPLAAAQPLSGGVE